MTIELYTTYLAATLILLLIPGPTVMLVVGYALNGGRRTAAATVPGVLLGDFTAMTLSLAGLSVVLAASAWAFTVLKWVGACYLIYLGVRMWTSRPEPADTDVAPASKRGLAMAGHAFAVTALNPKGIAFFAAFLPQFVTPAAPALPQLALLGGSFLVLAGITNLAYAWLAGGVRRAASRPTVIRTINRAGGTILIGAGVMTAALKRST